MLIFLRRLDRLNWKNKIKGFAENVLVILLAIVLASGIKAILPIARVEVCGESMNPSFLDGDKLIISKLEDISRYDVVATNRLASDNYKRLIKRVVGLPGETITISDGHIFANGEELEEYYQFTKEGLTPGEISICLREDEYFLLGDNSYNSLDSRIIGPVKEKQIMGVVK